MLGFTRLVPVAPAALLLIALNGFAHYARGQQPSAPQPSGKAAPVVIAVVNLNNVFKASEFAEQVKLLRDDEVTRLRAEIQRLKDTKSDEVAALEARLREKLVNERKLESAGQGPGYEKQKIYSAFMTEAKAAIRKISGEKGIDLVIRIHEPQRVVQSLPDDEILFHSERIDITDQVIEALKKKAVDK